LYFRLESGSRFFHQSDIRAILSFGFVPQDTISVWSDFLLFYFCFLSSCLETRESSCFLHARAFWS
jgi:hypothetical protein